MVATMLHSVATGNILPASIPLVCVDINPATVTKLADRGSSQARGIVTDVGLFLEQLAVELVPAYRRSLSRAGQVGRADQPGLGTERGRDSTGGTTRWPAPTSDRSRAVRAGSSNRSPAAETPPPMTRQSGSKAATRLASPTPSQSPDLGEGLVGHAGRRPRRPRSPSGR